MIEHFEEEEQIKVVREVLRVAENAVFTYPKPDFHSSDPTITASSFYEDSGHREVKVDWQQFSDNFEVIDKTTKNGRGIFILKAKDE